MSILTLLPLKNGKKGADSTLKTTAKNGVCYVKNYTKLSESLCVSRATLYRALDVLEEEQKIRRNGKEITLLEEYEP